MLHFFQTDATFYDLFDELATHVGSSAEHLRKLAAGFPASQQEIPRIHDEEQVVKGANHRVIEHLAHSFRPPIDAEDVHALSATLGEVVDTIDALAKRFPTYRIDAVEPHFVKQTEVLAEAAVRVNEAVHRLRTSHKLSDLSPTLIDIHRLENVGDDNHHAALAKLFEGASDPLYVMKWKELLTMVEHAIDRCEDVGNILERIVLKGA